MILPDQQKAVGEVVASDIRGVPVLLYQRRIAAKVCWFRTLSPPFPFGYEQLWNATSYSTQSPPDPRPMRLGSRCAAAAAPDLMPASSAAPDSAPIFHLTAPCPVSAVDWRQTQLPFDNWQWDPVTSQFAMASWEKRIFTEYLRLQAAVWKILLN